MKFLAVTRRVYLGDIYLSLMREGHEVRVFADPPPNVPAFGGIIPLVERWRDELDWVGRDGIVFFEGVGIGRTQDELRAQGFKVIGGSALGDRLEQDRAYGQSVLAGLGLPIAWSRGFASPAEALDWLAANPGMYVLKFDDNAYTTFVGDHPAGADVAFVLRRRADAGGVLLMEKLRGVEVGIGAYFDGQKFLMPACIDYEHKRFFPGDLGEMTGEMGTLASYDGSEKLFQATLGRVAPLLAGTGHVGYVNLNLIVDERGPFPLEFTCRIGNPGYAVLAAMQAGGWGDLFARMVAGDADGFRTRPGYSDRDRADRAAIPRDVGRRSGRGYAGVPCDRTGRLRTGQLSLGRHATRRGGAAAVPPPLRPHHDRDRHRPRRGDGAGGGAAEGAKRGGPGAAVAGRHRRAIRERRTRDAAPAGMAMNRAVTACLAGDISPQVAVCRMLFGGLGASEIRAEIAAAEPQSADPAWTALAAVVNGRDERLDDLARQVREHGGEHFSLDDPAAIGAFFDRAVAHSPEAGVALYSLGDPAILAAGTAEIVEWLVAERLVHAESSVLDLGCGIGRVAAAIRPHCGSVLGIDVSAGMVAEARHRHAGVAGLEFEVADGVSLPAGPFDLVLAVDSMPYMVQAGIADRIFGQAADAIRPGGAVAVLNLSYRGDLAADRADAERWAAAHGFEWTVDWPFALWDGVAFAFRR